MFKMVEQRKVWWPVTWDCPVDGGKVSKTQIQMQFILINPDDAQSLIDRAQSLDEDEAGSKPASERKAELLLELIADWKGVGDEEGQAVEFNRDALARFFRMPGTFIPVITAFARCMNGEPEERRKN
jgi:hypothetical protein